MRLIRTVQDDIDTDWLQNLPYASMARPDTSVGWFKYAFWYVFGPLHPYARRSVVALGLMPFDQFLDSKGRQKFLLGVIAPEYTMRQFIEHLIKEGYGNHFIAWKDNGELASLRLVDGFTHQYHVRVYDDGEVRAHYELTPEAYPIKHYYEIGLEPRSEYFEKLMGPMIVRSLST